MQGWPGSTAGRLRGTVQQQQWATPRQEGLGGLLLDTLQASDR